MTNRGIFAGRVSGLAPTGTTAIAKTKSPAIAPGPSYLCVAGKEA